MSALWMLYAMVVGAALLAGAVVVSALLRRWGRPERGVWATALVLACTLPVVLPLLRLGVPSQPGAGGDTVARGLLGVPRVIPVPEAAAVTDSIPWIALAWGLASLAYLVFLGMGGLRIRRARRRAQPAPHARHRLLRTGDLGPGVTGLLAPVILVPGWLGDLSPAMRRWVVRHEIEHLRGYDLPLRHLALVIRLVMPWNPAVWLLSFGLFRSLETDCDQRVLRRRTDLRGYAETLLAVAGRSSLQPLPLGAFHPAVSSLEHRIRTMTTSRSRLTPLRLLALLALSPLALMLACEMPTPTPTAPVPDPVPEEVTPVPTSQLGDEPTFTPFTAAPDIQNRAEVVAELENSYPELLRDAGIGGTTNVWFFINDAGVVEDLRVQRSSGHAELDRAALQVARTIRFAPARNGDEPVAVWVAFPITFAVR